MKKFLQEFKEFALKGNVIDMAVGTMIGGAFSNIVTSLVSNIMQPLIGLLLGRFDEETKKFSSFSIKGIQIGDFFASVFNFIIMAFCIFLFVKLISAVKDSLTKKKKETEEEEPAEPELSNEAKLLAEIKQLLEEKKNG